jgi:hypothetical protein
MGWTWHDFLELPQFVCDVLIERLEREAREREA